MIDLESTLSDVHNLPSNEPHPDYGPKPFTNTTDLGREYLAFLSAAEVV